MKEAYEQMIEDSSDEIAETFIEKFYQKSIANNQIHNPAKIRKLAWNMCENALDHALKDTTRMFLTYRINKAEYEMMIDIISRALQKIKTMHT